MRTSGYGPGVHYNHYALCVSYDVIMVRLIVDVCTLVCVLSNARIKYQWSEYLYSVTRLTTANSYIKCANHLMDIGLQNNNHHTIITQQVILYNLLEL